MFCMTGGTLPRDAVSSGTGRGTSLTPSGTRDGSQVNRAELKRMTPPGSTSRACRSRLSWFKAMSTFKWSPWLSTFASEIRRRNQVWPPRMSDW